MSPNTVIGGNFSLGTPFLIDHIKTAAEMAGVKITSIWHDDEDFVVHINHGTDIKLKFRFVVYKDALFGIQIRRVVTKKFLPLSGDFISFVLPMFRRLIERSMPLASIKVDGDTIYLENVYAHRIRLEGKILKGNITFILQGKQ